MERGDTVRGVIVTEASEIARGTLVVAADTGVEDTPQAATEKIGKFYDTTTETS